MIKKLPPKILVIESDESLSASVCNAVERYWFNVLRSNDADIALKLALTNSPNIIVISSRLRDVSAIEMAVRLRKVMSISKIPLIFLVDEGESSNNYSVVGNEFIEIVYRPFTPNQLITAIRSLLRRSQPTFQDKIIKYRDIVVDLSSYKVLKGNRVIHLGPIEFKILQLFVQSPKTIFSRQQIIEYVWGNDKVIEARTVDVHVNRLRSSMKEPEKMLKQNDKLKTSSEHIENQMSISELKNEELQINKIKATLKDSEKSDYFIKTVRSAGYCLNLPGEKD